MAHLAMETRPDDPDSLEDAILECLDAEDVDAALTVLCERQPARAEQIRRVAARLRALGAFPSDRDDGDMQVLGSFQIRERLGEGGMGVVYRAWQDPPGREVALKIIRPELMHFGGSRARFNREVEASVKLSHPGIVPVYEVGTTDGVPWFSMAFVRGRSLAAVIGTFAGRGVAGLTGADLRGLLRAGEEAEGSGSDHSTSTTAFLGDWVAACLDIVQGVASALSHAHARGVLHRDVKPSNIMLSAAGHALLLDFGLAHTEDSQRLTNSQAVLGSLPYMPPEMLRGEVTPSASLDVYSLGVTLYELLTLRSPFLGATPELTRRNVLDARPEPPRRRNPAIPKDLETICLTAMAEEPRRRYAGMADLLRDLDSFRQGRAIAASPDTLVQRAQRFYRHNRVLCVATLAIILLLSAWGATGLLLYLESERQRAVAERNQSIAGLNGARQALLLHRVDQAIESLAMVKGERSWEWRHLLSRVDTSTGVPLRSENPLTALSVGATHAALAAADAVIVVDLKTLQPVREIPVSRIRAVTIAGTRVVWTDGERLHSTGVEGGAVQDLGSGRWAALAATPDGARFAAVSDDGRVAVWKADGTPCSGGRRLSGRLLSAVGMSADKLACADAMGSIWIMDHELQGRTQVGRHAGIVDVLTFGPRGRLLASAGRDRLVRLWNVETGTQDGEPLPHEERVRAVGFHPERSELLTAADHVIYRWRLDTRRKIGALHGHRKAVSELGWRKAESALEGRAEYDLLSVAADGTLRTWDPERIDIRHFQGHGEAIRQVAVFPDGDRVAVVVANSTGRVFDTRRGSIAYDNSIRSTGGASTCVDDAGRSLAWIDSGEVRVHDVEDFANRWSVPAEGGEFRVGAFSPDGRLLAVAGTLAVVLSVFDADSGERLDRTFPVLDGEPRALRFTRDGRRLVVAGSGEIGVRVLDAATGRQVAALSPRAHAAVAVDAAGRFIAAGGAGGVQVWRADTLEPEFHIGREAVADLTYEPRSGRLLTVGEDGLVRVYAGDVEVMVFDSVGTEIRALGFDARGTNLITGDDLGQIRIWPAVAPEDVDALWAELTRAPVQRREVSPVVVLQGEHLACTAHTGGELKVQRAADGRRWRGGAQLWWDEAAVGSRLVLRVPVARSGRYALSARLTRASNYTTVQLKIDDAPLGEPLGLKSKRLEIVDQALGEVELQRGVRLLTVEVVGPKGGFGLDELVLTPVGDLGR